MYQELLKLKTHFHPREILDIGANQGHFAIMCSHVWPFATVTLAEGNENCREDLNHLPYEFHICLLSDSVKEVIFYIDKSNFKSTGSSYYKENSVHFENAIEEKRTTNTLDILFKDRQFDFIKIDTQGSELDILRGGKEIVQKAQYVLLEVSIEEYNSNAPLYDEVISYMNSIGFDDNQVIEEHKNNQGGIFQVDVLFTRKAK